MTDFQCTTKTDSCRLQTCPDAFSVPKNSGMRATRTGIGLAAACRTRAVRHKSSLLGTSQETRRAASQAPAPARAGHPPLFFGTENRLEKQLSLAETDFRALL